MAKPQKKKILTLLTLYIFLATLAPPTLKKAISLPRSKAVIKSCATPDDDRKRPKTRKLFGPTMGAPSGAPAPQGGALPPPVMKQSFGPPTSEVEARPTRRKKPKKGELDVHLAGKKVDKKVRKASELYLSNDDSMSLASAQRVIYAINNFLPLYREEIRPHEFLNYFHFQTNPVGSQETFSVQFQMAPRKKGETLALAVQGKTLTKAKRRPAVLTFILDKSGSMRAQGKMEYLKEGLEELKGQLKKGDVINVVEFDHEVCNAIEGFVVGRDRMRGYDQTVKELEPRGSTNLHDGLVGGYKLAEKSYDPAKINRVILITDAIANTGQLSPELMASIGKYYDTKKIGLSGIGVGLDFNDELLDTLTDKGKGAYLFLGIKEAIPRVFGEDFISLLDTIARDVHFKSTFPQGVHLDIFYGEEVSTEKAQVQAIHYFANTSQLFLLDLNGGVKEDSQFKLQIEFEDPLTGKEKITSYSRTVGEIQAKGRDNVTKARLMMAFAKLMEQTALPGKRPHGSWKMMRGRHEPKGKDAKAGRKLCAETLPRMEKLKQQFSDQETEYVLDLADKYCSRY